MLFCSNKGVPDFQTLLSMYSYEHTPGCACVRLPSIWWEYSGYPCMPKAYRRERWESSVLKGQESHVKLPLFTPVTKWTGLDTDCLPMRSRAKSNGTDRMRKRDAAYFYSVHLLPELFLPFPSLPSTASAQYKHTGTWISGLLCVWSTPSEHNERLSSQRYGKYIFKIFRRLINCSKLGGDAMISHTFIHLAPLFYMSFH